MAGSVEKVGADMAIFSGANLPTLPETVEEIEPPQISALQLSHPRLFFAP